VDSDQGYVPIPDGGKLYYRTVGSGPNTVVIPALHYLAADLEPLAQRHRLIFYDQRGRGGSDPIEDETLVWSDYEMCDLEAIRQHFNLDQMSLIGWSYLGGVTALYTLENNDRVRRLVLMCPIPPRLPSPYAPKEELNKRAKSRIDPLGVKGLDKMREAGIDSEEPAAYCREHNRVYLPGQMAKPEALARMHSDPCIYPNEWPQNVEQHWKKHFPPESMEFDWRHKLGEVTTPTLVIHGSEDFPVEASREWVSALPEACLLVIAGSGHFPHLEAPDVFFPAVERFLSGEWPDEERGHITSG
jgi:proline iminopeptidase